MNWKIERDPYMRVVARRWGERAVWEAGFFADDDDRDAALDDVGWLCTPVAHVADALGRLDDDRTPVVLLATGGFWPPHTGHLALLDRARAALEHDGLAVVGGYVSPGHDRYLRLKWGEVAPPAAARISMVERLLTGSDWLAVDPWEALHRRTAVNFTDVVARLQTYLRHHLDPRLEVGFVCGGDNARFSLAFARHGRCVVVGRPGSEPEVSAWRADPRTAPSTRIRWVDGTVPTASSAMDPGGWQPPPVPPLRLRLEDQRSVAALGLGAGRWRSFQAALHRLLGQGQEVSPVRVEDQVIPAGIGPDTGPQPKLISLDPLTDGTVDLGVSRAFDLGGRRRLGHGPRPGHPPVEVQAAAIAPGDYVLVDDDSVTGSTLAFAIASLPRGVRVDHVVTLLPRAAGEIADSRDFLVGTDDGGLVVRLPDGSFGRAPYVLPYVDPHARCGVPAADVVPLSIALWRLNADAFAGTGITVADLPGAVRRLFSTAGREPAESVEAVCRWHGDTLGAYLPADP